MRRTARDLFLVPLQRRVRCEGWGGPLLVKRGWRGGDALEWTRADAVVRLSLARVGSEWVARLLRPGLTAGTRPDGLYEVDGVGRLRLETVAEGVRVSLGPVVDVDHLERFARAAFGLTVSGSVRTA
jgi:hypothetical protein